MPWLTILVTLVAFFLQKKNGASSTKAALVAGLAGAGTYMVTHKTDWGQANLGALDGVTGEGGTVVKGEDGKPIIDPATNKPITTGPSASGPNGAGSGGGTNLFDVLKGWGATGTAAVVGTTAASTGSGIFSNPWVIVGLGGLALLLLAK